MTAHSLSAGPSLHLVNDRVLVRQHGQMRAGRISSIHRYEGGVEYVVHLGANDGAMGTVVNVWSTSARRTSLTAIPDTHVKGRRSG